MSRALRLLAAGLAIPCLALIATPARAAGVQVYLTPTTAIPGPHVRTTVHVRGLQPGGAAEIVVGVVGQEGGQALADIHTHANNAGAIDRVISFAATQPGAYVVSIQLPSSTTAPPSATLVVKRPITRSCPGTTALPHIFGKGPEVLVQGTVAMPGSTVRLLGIGFDPCSPVSLATAPPHADFGPPAPTGVSTDRFGDFRVRVHIAASYKPDILFVSTSVNGVPGPVVTIAVNHP